MKKPPQRILVVERDIFIHRAFQTLFQSNGHRVALIDNVADALKIIEKEKFDLVITCLRLPSRAKGEARYGRGLRVIKEARARPEPPEVWLISGILTDDAKKMALELGAKYVLQKPNEPFEILKKEGYIQQ